MSELEERLNALLASPEDMNRLAAMASQLMGQIAPEGGGEKPSAPSPGGGAVQEILKNLGGTGSRTELLRGMRPYLSKARAQRLERALRIASAAKLATAALGQMGGDDGL